MNDPLKPEPKPDDLTQTAEPESIQLDEKEADEIPAAGIPIFEHKEQPRHLAAFLTAGVDRGPTPVCSGDFILVCPADFVTTPSRSWLGCSEPRAQASGLGMIEAGH